jgi:hypothetical protein
MSGISIEKLGKDIGIISLSKGIGLKLASDGVKINCSNGISIRKDNGITFVGSHPNQQVK